MSCSTGSSFRRSRLGLVLTAALLAVPAAAEVWPAEDVKTAIALRRGPAESLGLALENVREAVPSFAQPVYSASRGKDVAFASLGPLGLGAEIEKGRIFTRLAGGAVIHRGGFDLVYRGGRMPLQGFVFASSAQPRTFELRSAAGELAFTGDLAHFELDPLKGRLLVFNIDLRIGRDLAARLGAPELEGMAVGVMAIEARLVVPGGRPAAPAPAASVAGVPGCGDWSGQQDVALINVPTVGQAERDTVNGRVGITPSASLKNVGSANVPWFTKFSGNHAPYNNSQHPFLVWSLYRVAGGRIEQLGLSDVKHAFLTINLNCTAGACTDDHILGVGCEDVYGEGNNEDEFGLSFRSEVTAHTGAWESQGSHFDQDNNNTQDHPPENPDPPFTHRLMVAESDLQTPGATYFIEAWYVVRDDVNIFNSMGYRRVTPSFNSGSGAWSFGLPNVFVQGSALGAWVDPNNPGSANATTGVDTGEGHLRLAVKTVDLGGGSWRYDYALVNHDFDRQVGSFSIPLDGAAATAAYFRDLDALPGNDWQVSVSPAAITWTRTAGAGLDWGAAYNFGFVSDQAPTAGNAGFTPVEAGSPGSFAVATKIPSAGGLLFADGFESGSAGGWH